MRALVLLIALNFNLISESFAFTCSGTDESGEDITISADREVITIKRANFRPTSIPIDSHSGGVVSGQGILIKYQNHFGCIRNVLVVGFLKRNRYEDLATLEFDGCTGGSTPDQLCFPRGSH